MKTEQNRREPAIIRRLRDDEVGARPAGSIRICCAGWRLSGRTRCGRWTSPTSRWPRLRLSGRCARLVQPRSYVGRIDTMEEAFSSSRGGCFGSSRQAGSSSIPTGLAFAGSAFTGVLASNGISDQLDGKGAWRKRQCFVERHGERQGRGRCICGRTKVHPRLASMADNIGLL